MRPILPAALVAAAALAAIGAGSAASASQSPAPAKAGKSYQLYVSFDHHESLRPDTRVVDASGHRHTGRVLVDAGGHLAPVRGIAGRAADFPNRCRSCGRAIVEFDDGRGLDPVRSGFRFGAYVRVTHRESATGANLVQKGYFGQAGGQFKLQLSAGGFPSCVIYGSRGRVKVDAAHSIANNRWHQITCERTPTGVMIRVDGTVRASGEGATGRIANEAPIRIGGKKVSAGNKQFHGDLDSVFLRFVHRT